MTRGISQWLFPLCCPTASSISASCAPAMRYRSTMNGQLSIRCCGTRAMRRRCAARRWQALSRRRTHQPGVVRRRAFQCRRRLSRRFAGPNTAVLDHGGSGQRRPEGSSRTRKPVRRPSATRRRRRTKTVVYTIRARAGRLLSLRPARHRRARTRDFLSRNGGAVIPRIHDSVLAAHQEQRASLRTEGPAGAVRSRHALGRGFAAGAKSIAKNPSKRFFACVGPGEGLEYDLAAAHRLLPDGCRDDLSGDFSLDAGAAEHSRI